MKFLCDQMLARVGRWLRAAGYDTAIAAERLPDNLVLAQARQEKRILITRDQAFKEMALGKGRVIVLASNTVGDCIKELSLTLNINWLYHPFSRCLICNEVLDEPDQNALKDVPQDVLEQAAKLWYCPHCRKVYWDGSHTKRMRKKLIFWHAEFNR